MPGWMGAGLGAAAGANAWREEQKHQAEMAEAMRREAEWQANEEMMDLRLQAAKDQREQQLAEDRVALDAWKANFGGPGAGAGAVDAEEQMRAEADRVAAMPQHPVRLAGSESEAQWLGTVVDNLTPGQRAAFDRWDVEIQAGRMDPAAAKRQLSAWGDQQRLHRLEASLNTLASYAQQMAAESDDEQYATQVQDLMQAVQESPSEESVEKALGELREMEFQRTLRVKGGQDRDQAIHEINQFLVSTPGVAAPQPTITSDDEYGAGAPKTNPHYEDYMEAWADLHSAVVIVEHPGTEDLVVKDYAQLVEKLKFLANPNQQQASKDYMAGIREEQDALQETNPDLYESMKSGYTDGYDNVRVDKREFDKRHQHDLLRMKQEAASPEHRAALLESLQATRSDKPDPLADGVQRPLDSDSGMTDSEAAFRQATQQRHEAAFAADREREARLKMEQASKRVASGDAPKWRPAKGLGKETALIEGIKQAHAAGEPLEVVGAMLAEASFDPNDSQVQRFVMALVAKDPNRAKEIEQRLKDLRAAKKAARKRSHSEDADQEIKQLEAELAGLKGQ